MKTKPFLVILLAASLAATSPALQSSGPDRAAMAEDVEVLRRLLVRQLEPESRPAGVALSAGDHTLLYGYTLSTATVPLTPASPVGSSRGWYVPGTGALVTVDLRVPTRRVQRTESAAPNGDEPDLWERTEREVRGQGPRAAERPQAFDPPAAGRTLYWQLQRAQGVALELDEAAVQRATDAVLEALLDHGARLEGLAAGETITVALHVGASSQPSFTVPLGEGDDADVYWNQLFLESSSSRVRPRHVVVQVARDDLRDLQRGAALRDEVRARALVESY